MSSYCQMYTVILLNEQNQGFYVIKFKYYFLSVLSPVTDIRVRSFSIQLITAILL